ncbi:MAG: VOC family protein [Bacteroidota bacterium]
MQPPFIFYLYVDDVTDLTQRMKESSAMVISEPEKQFWGDLKSRVKDPFGYYWDLAQVI